jgi:aspartate/methionine/tyrosine aminotransferase
MFSMSKSYSDPGARLGVMVGSKEFVEDFILVKGNTDSGPVPGLMAGYGELFKDLEKSKALLDETYKIYRKRLDYLVPKLKSIGLRPACETTAGFFTLGDRKLRDRRRSLSRCARKWRVVCSLRRRVGCSRS